MHAIDVMVMVLKFENSLNIFGHFVGLFGFVLLVLVWLFGLLIYSLLFEPMLSLKSIQFLHLIATNVT